MYKEAIRQNLRFQVGSGLLTIHQLFSLGIDELDKYAVTLSEAYDSSGAKSFIKKKTEKDKLLKLRMDIVLDVLDTKCREEEEAKSRYQINRNNAKIDSLIAEKRDEKLSKLSIEELEAMRM